MRQKTARTVGALTASREAVRVFDAGRLAGAAVLALACSAANAAALSPATRWQDIQHISTTAETYIKDQLPDTAANTQVRAGQLDARLKLSRCDAELDAFLRPGARLDTRTIVGVRCSGSRPWKVYVPVDVVVTARVLVPARSFPKGHRLASSDLVFDERDVSRAHNGYFTDPAALAGQVARRPMTAGRIITPAMIEADKIVRRGQSVTLSVDAGGIAIRMAGKALSDGAMHERIRVENVTSGRVVEGIVRSPEQVEVLFDAGRKDF